MLVSMANLGPDRPNTNASQFFFTTMPAPSLDGKHVAFGRVVQGMEVVKRVEAAGTLNGATSKRISIDDCGQVGVKSFGGGVGAYKP